MGDIEALRLLTTELKSIHTLPDPPTSYDGIEKFDTITTKVIDHAFNTTQHVARYGEAISAKIEEMRFELNQTTKKIEEQIKRALGSITETYESESIPRITVPGKGDRINGRYQNEGQSRSNTGKKIRNNGAVGTNGNLPSKDMDYLLLLQKLEMKKLRLEEFMIQTQEIMDKVKQGASVTNGDIELLKGCLGSWMDDKQESYQAEQKRLSDERDKRDEEARNAKAAEKRRREEDEERKRKEEEERRQKEEEERQKREKEEQLKQEEEERKLKEDEERKRKEEEDRIQKEEEERQKKEDERLRQEEETRKIEEMERMMREAEERTKLEAKKKEEEEKRRRDPANWTPHTYRRPDGESYSFHRDICCHVFAMPDTLQEEDLECLASDEWRENDEHILAIGEQLASSLTEVKLKEGDKDLKEPIRICVPHCSVYDSSDEVIIKASIDGGEWTNHQPVTVPSRQTSHPDLNYAGIDVANFRSVKVLAVAKTRSQEFSVDKSGISQASSLDKNIKLFVPRDTFHTPTKLKLEIRQMKDHILSFATQYYDHCRNVLSTSSVMAITCDALTEQPIELDLTRSAPKACSC